MTDHGDLPTVPSRRALPGRAEELAERLLLVAHEIDSERSDLAALRASWLREAAKRLEHYAAENRRRSDDQ